MLASSEMLTFEEFRLDRRGGGLSRRDDSGAYVSVAIGSRALDVLGVLIARPGELVAKDEISAAVWPGTGRRGQQPDRPDLGIAPGTRSGPRARQLHSDGTRARVSLCRLGIPYSRQRLL